MSHANLFSAGLLGIDAYLIHVEVDLSKGLPGWSTVGLAESAVKESKDRVLSALYNNGYEVPVRKITLNLAPADVKKSGTAFDLPVALGLLAASGQIAAEKLKNYIILGELSLTGELRPVRGILAAALMAKEMNLSGLIVPESNLVEAQPVSGIEILGARDLPQVVEFILSGSPLSTAPEKLPPSSESQKHLPDFSEIKGQEYAKRALTIAAAGFHHVLLVGPPGTGKSMLASRMASILPPMSFTEQITTTKIYSMLGMLKKQESLITERPFRSPHHSISDAGLIGGGTSPRPGEVSLAHNGVLFLDELTEFKRHVLELLRQPLETHQVIIARALQSLSYPARFLLITAMNPCPCGHYGNPQGECVCTEIRINNYQSKISGPLLDRIDLQVEVMPISFAELQHANLSESSAQIRERSQLAWERQAHRFKETTLVANSQMGPREIRKFCKLETVAEKILEQAVQKLKLSARAFHRLLKVARTISDLDQGEDIQVSHLTEAIAYRSRTQLLKS